MRSPHRVPLDNILPALLVPIALGLTLVLTLGLGSCARSPKDSTAPRLTLYSSVDDALLDEIIHDFQIQTGIRVDLVGDSEATKTTGLMHRLLAERDHPRADVWWSSEPFATERLAREGVLAPVPESIRSKLPDWPSELANEYWIGFALRSRVLAVRVGEFDSPPTTLEELTHPRFKGRVGIARPEFGTTRGHLAALAYLCGLDSLESWLTHLHDNNVRLYTSNSAVVRAIAQGEILVGLTDTDDVWAAQRNDWPVEIVYETSPDEKQSPQPDQLCATGPLLIPNTVGLVAGGPHPEQAAAFMAFVLSERTSRRLAQSDSHNLPVRRNLQSEFARWGPPALEGSPESIGGLLVPVGPVADMVPEALAIVERTLTPR